MFHFLGDWIQLKIKLKNLSSFISLLILLLVTVFIPQYSQGQSPFSGKFIKAVRPNSNINLQSVDGDLCFGGDVYDLSFTDDQNYIVVGGDFSVVGKCTGAGIAVSESGTMPTNFDRKTREILGTVQVVISDGGTGWYVAGNIKSIGGVAQKRIVHILSDGSLDTAFNPSFDGLSGDVKALALYSGQLFFGGDFITNPIYNGVAVAISDSLPVYPTALYQSGVANFDQGVFAVVSDENGGWYVAGSFENVQGHPISKVAHILSNGFVDLTFNLTFNSNAYIYDLKFNAGTLYISGSFYLVNGQTRTNMAAVDTVTNTLTSWSPNVTGSVAAMDLGGDGNLYFGGGFNQVNALNAGSSVALVQLSDGAPVAGFPKFYGEWNETNVISDGSGGWYVGGDFTAVGISNRSILAHIKSDLTLDANFSPSLNGRVTSMSFNGTKLFVGGTFSQVNGLARVGMVALDPVSGAVDPGWVADLDSVGPYKVRATATTVYIGGYFNSVNGQARRCLAAVSATDGSVLPFNPNANFTVWDFALDGSVLYVGGGFTSIGGASRNYLGAVDAATGTATSFSITANQQVQALAISDSKLYVGGYFSSIGGISRSKIAQIDLVGNTVTSWNPNANSDVRAIDVRDGYVYLGGLFTSVGGASRNRLAAVAISTGTASAWNPSPSGRVTSIVADGTNVAIGGAFVGLGGAARTSLAAVSISSAQVTSWSPSPTGSIYGSPIKAVSVLGNTVFVGGDFSNLSGSSRKNIGAIDKTTAATISWNPNPSGGSTYSIVNVVKAVGSYVYAGGYFGTIGGQSRLALAQLNVSDGLATSWNGSVNYSGPIYSTSVRGLAVAGSSIYIAGYFDSAGGQSRSGYASLDATTALANVWDPLADMPYGMAIASDGSYTFIGGAFTTVGPKGRAKLAALDSTTGALQSWKPAVNGSVNALAVAGTNLFLGGSFTSVSISTKNYLASFNLSDMSLNSANINTDNAVHSFLVYSSDLYFGGDFTSVNGTPRGAIAKVDWASGSLQSWSPNITGSSYVTRVSSLKKSGGLIYAGGLFDTVGSDARKNLVALDAVTAAATSWQPNPNIDFPVLAISGNYLWAGGYWNYTGSERRYLVTYDLTTGLPISGSVNAPSEVNALAEGAGKVFIGGSFHVVSPYTRKNIAMLKVSDGTLTSWSPSLDGYVDKLAVSNGKVYVFGDFANINGTPRNTMGSINISDGSVTAWDPSPNNWVYFLKAHNSKIYIGGDFTQMSGENRNYFVEVNGADGSLTSLNISVDAAVTALDISNNTLYLGGSFTSCAGQPRASLAAYDLGTGLTSWAPLLTRNSGLPNLVSIAVDNSKVFFAGSFDMVNAVNRSFLAAVDRATGATDPWNPAIILPDYMNLTGLTIAGGNLYIIGSSTSIMGSPRNGLASVKISDLTLNSLNPAITGGGGAWPNLYVIKSKGNFLYLGGPVYTIDQKIRSGLVGIDATTGLEIW